MGIGFIFMGLEHIESTMAPIKNWPPFIEAIAGRAALHQLDGEEHDVVDPRQGTRGRTDAASGCLGPRRPL